jgi:hypothetical protein
MDQWTSAQVCRKRGEPVSDTVSLMANPRSGLRGLHFQDQIIILCVRWYLRYCLTYRDLEELMAVIGGCYSYGMCSERRVTEP